MDKMVEFMEKKVLRQFTILPGNVLTGRGRTKMIKILIADSDWFQRQMLEPVIHSRFPSQCICRMAENGREALDLATLWNADLILIDIDLAGISGMETAKLILLQRPECRIIFVSVHSLFSYAQQAIQLGACDYLLKPVDPNALERAVSRAINQHNILKLAAKLAPEALELQESSANDMNNLLMDRVKKYLHHNYMHHDISLDTVSSMANMNTSYFSVQFKRVFGVNFVDYLTQLRIQAAKELLADPTRPASEVAGMVGYESANYFSRAFKKKTGMTPSQYRNSISSKKI